MPGPSPLVGYNTNVRHKGKLYHIQTEDSGVNHPHVITHLFADGGRIIASRKTGYSEHLGSKDLPSIVKKLMQDQHKSMFIELRDCVYDEQPQPPASVSMQPQPPASAVVAVAVTPRARTGPLELGAADAARHPLTASVLAEAALAQAGAAAQALQDADALLHDADALHAAEPGHTAEPPPAPGAGAAARAAMAAPRTAVPVPAPKFVGTPPPMAIASRPALDIEELDRAAEARLLGSTIGRARPESARRGAGRYQQTVPAKPSRAPRAPSPRSIFGAEALRGKSLDEVILSYLADDAGDSER